MQVNGSEKPVADLAREVEIPANVRIRCPLVGFKLRSVLEHCTGCEHKRGLADRFPGSSHPFAVRFAVLCSGEAVRRELYELEAE